MKALRAPASDSSKGPRVITNKGDQAGNGFGFRSVIRAKSLGFCGHLVPHRLVPRTDSCNELTHGVNDIGRVLGCPTSPVLNANSEAHDIVAVPFRGDGQNAARQSASAYSAPVPLRCLQHRSGGGIGRPRGDQGLVAWLCRPGSCLRRGIVDCCGSQGSAERIAVDLYLPPIAGTRGTVQAQNPDSRGARPVFGTLCR